MKPEVSPDCSRPHTNPKRKRRQLVVPPSLAILGILHPDAEARGSEFLRVVPCPRASTRCVLSVLLLLAAVFSPAAAAEEESVRIDCTPRTFHVVPGEPIRLELTVLADSAAPIRLHVPGDPLLKLRALEKLPVQRAGEGAIMHQHVVVWQGLQPGTVKIKTLAIETGGRKLLFPEVTITLRDPGP